MLIAKDEDKQFEKLKEGTHQAVCYSVWDLGDQPVEYQGQQKIQHKIMIAFETKERMKEGEYANQRFGIFKEYTLSLGEKSNLRKDLENWFAKKFTEETAKAGFDIEKLIGKNVLLSITHNKKGYATISGMSKPMEGQEKLIPENSNTKIPEWVQKKINNAVVISASENFADDTNDYDIDMSRTNNNTKQDDGMDFDPSLPGQDEIPF